MNLNSYSWHAPGPHVFHPAAARPGARGAAVESHRHSLWIDGESAGFTSLISWSCLDIARDRASPVSHYAAPFEFTGRLFKRVMTLQAHLGLPGDAVGQAEMARQ